MKFIVHRAANTDGWRWLLRDGVEVVARGPVILGEDAEWQALVNAFEVRFGIAQAEIVTDKR